MVVAASEAHRNLFPLLEQVNNDRTPVEIMSRRGNAFLVPSDDYEALEEATHLLLPSLQTQCDCLRVRIRP